MFQGPLRPLAADLPISRLLAFGASPGPLGAWVRRCSPGQRIYRVDHASAPVVVSPDLGFLLTRCDRIVVREGEGAVVLDAEAIIGWRALQVATATPYLSDLERLRASFSGLRDSAQTVLVPLRNLSPEEVLAQCVSEGIPVTGSRIVYAPLI